MCGGEGDELVRGGIRLGGSPGENELFVRTGVVIQVWSLFMLCVADCPGTQQPSNVCCYHRERE